MGSASTTITIDGTPGRIGRIEATRLGYEDHGIFTIGLQMDYGGSGQTIGGYALDKSLPDGGRRDRVGTAYGMEFIRRTMKACGCGTWEGVKGRTIVVLLDGDGFDARPIGIAPLPTEGGETFLFDSIKSLAEAA